MQKGRGPSSVVGRHRLAQSRSASESACTFGSGHTPTRLRPTQPQTENHRQAGRGAVMSSSCAEDEARRKVRPSSVIFGLSVD